VEVDRPEGQADQDGAHRGSTPFLEAPPLGAHMLFFPEKALALHVRFHFFSSTKSICNIPG
jgi:hypothetical protein